MDSFSDGLTGGNVIAGIIIFLVLVLVMLIIRVNMPGKHTQTLNGFSSRCVGGVTYYWVPDRPLAPAFNPDGSLILCEDKGE